jgi:hypothetical protein
MSNEVNQTVNLGGTTPSYGGKLPPHPKVYRLRHVEGWYFGGPFNWYPSERAVRYAIRLLTGLLVHPVDPAIMEVETFTLDNGLTQSAKEFLGE